MADKRINDLPAVTAPDPADVAVLDGVSTRKITAANLIASANETPATLKNKTINGADNVLTNVPAGSMAGQVPVANGGTGASTASGARTNLGVAIGSDVQAYDVELAALASVTSAADQFPYFTGSGTAALTSLGAFSRSVLGQSNAVNWRSAIGVVIGTNVQAQNANLDSLSALTAAADQLPYFSSSGTLTMSITGFSAFSRSVLSQSSALNWRAAIGAVIGTDVQAFDSDLAALAANSANGFWARTAAGTGSARTITGSTGISVTNGDGVSGNPTIAPADDLAALEALSGTNTIYYRSGASAWTGVTIGANLTFTGGTLAATGGGGGSVPSAPQGRITLTTGVASMQASVAAATRVYYTPAAGNQIPLYGGSSYTMTPFVEVFQDTTDTTKSPAAVAANSLYDLFAWLDGGTFRVTRGPAWTNDTTRSLALVTVDGFQLNSASITNGPASQRGTWVGTIGSNSSSTIDWILGTLAAGGGGAVLGLWNAYNRVPVAVQIKDSNNWTYTYSVAPAWRAADNSSTFRCTFVRGAAGEAIAADYNSISQVSAGTVTALIGIGLDTTTVSTGSVDGNFGWPSNPVPLNAKWAGLISEGATGVGIGRHYISSIEKVLNPGNSQFFGVDYSALTVSLTA